MNWKRWCCALILLLSVGSAGAEEEATLESRVKEWAAAFNKNDPKLMAGFYDNTEELNMMVSMGLWWKGIEEVKTIYKEDAKHVVYYDSKVQNVRLRDLGDTGLAAFEHLYKLKAIDGWPKFRVHIRTTMTWRKMAGDWKIVSEHSSAMDGVERILRLYEGPDGEEQVSTSPEYLYQDKLEAAEEVYRIGKAREIADGDRVVIYLLSFDGLKEASVRSIFSDTYLDIEKGHFPITSYQKQTRILEGKTLEKEAREQFLPMLSSQVAVPKHMGGAFCHYPIHGVRVYREDYVIYEGSFCWERGNFGFRYPHNGGWLDTNEELEKALKEFMPIPASEIERFEKALKPKKKAE